MESIDSSLHLSERNMKDLQLELQESLSRPSRGNTSRLLFMDIYRHKGTRQNEWTILWNDVLSTVYE